MVVGCVIDYLIRQGNGLASLRDTSVCACVCAHVHVFMGVCATVRLCQWRGVCVCACAKWLFIRFYNLEVSQPPETLLLCCFFKL